MTTFFIDLWHDLREKRLWPVAVGLLAAIVAVPVMLFKPASDAAPPTTVTPKTGAADTLPVVAVESGPTEGSKLEAFDEKNPFKPMKDLATDDAAGTNPAAADAGAGAGSASGGSGSGGSGAGASSASGGSGSSAGGSTRGSTGGSAPSTPGGQATTTTWFHYTADFSFGETGSLKKYENVGSFTLLPDEKTPAIVFVGIDNDHESAMFFISDPAYQADGEVKCNANGPDCKFVTLKIGDSHDEETFTATDGSVSYDLKLLKVNREELGSGDSPKASGDSGKAKGIAATGAGVATAA